VGGREGFQRELGLQAERHVFSDEVAELAGIKVRKNRRCRFFRIDGVEDERYRSFVGLLRA
jgi:hypothetical protein